MSGHIYLDVTQSVILSKERQQPFFTWIDSFLAYCFAQMESLLKLNGMAEQVQKAQLLRKLEENALIWFPFAMGLSWFFQQLADYPTKVAKKISRPTSRLQ